MSNEHSVHPWMRTILGMATLLALLAGGVLYVSAARALADATSQRVDKIEAKQQVLEAEAKADRKAMTAIGTDVAVTRAVVLRMETVLNKMETKGVKE